VDNLDGFAGLRSRRRRAAAERAAVFFRAVLVAVRPGRLRAVFFAFGFRELFRVVRFATPTSARAHADSMPGC
jgi:hypothetical protein